MIKNTAIKEQIFSKIDQKELVNLVMSLSDFVSLTGKESEIAQFILNWFEETEFYTIKQVVENDRFNAVGILRGSGGGSSLTYNGHLDIKLESHLPPIKAYTGRGLVYGTELANQRGSIAAFMIGAKAIKEAGIQLRGDLLLATVVGEISTASVGQYQDTQDRGEGLGTRHLLANGLQTDYAVVTDRSDFSLLRAQAGVAYYKISTKGLVQYTPVMTRAKYEKSNAILHMTRAIEAVENWARQYERDNIYPCVGGGQIEPKVAVTAIESGLPHLTPEGWRLPFKPSQTPPNCNLYIDVRVPPSMTPMKVKHQLEDVLRELPFECDVEMFRSQMGYEGKGPEIDYLYSVVEDAYESVFREKPPSPSPADCSVWTDTNLYWEIGIPAVKWGPSDVGKYPSRRVAEIEGLVRAAKVYSLIALEVCGFAESSANE